jgi:hypothetical protein
MLQNLNDFSTIVQRNQAALSIALGVAVRAKNRWQASPSYPMLHEQRVNCLRQQIIIRSVVCNVVRILIIFNRRNAQDL